MTRYAKYLQTIKKMNQREEQTAVVLTKTNLAMLLRLREQYTQILRDAGDEAGAKEMESTTPNDLISLLHAGFSEASLDKSVDEMKIRGD